MDALRFWPRLFNEDPPNHGEVVPEVLETYGVAGSNMDGPLASVGAYGGQNTPSAGRGEALMSAIRKSQFAQQLMADG